MELQYWYITAKLIAWREVSLLGRLSSMREPASSLRRLSSQLRLNRRSWQPLHHSLLPHEHPLTASVTAAYGVSWAYLIGDVAFTTYKAKEAGPTPIEAANFSEPTRLTMVAVKRSVFQSVASMALPAFTIHTAVRQASKMVAKSSNITLKRWGPTAVGISIVPALPFLFDHPVSTRACGNWEGGGGGESWKLVARRAGDQNEGTTCVQRAVRMFPRIPPFISPVARATR